MDHLVAGGEKREGEGKFFMNVIRKGWRRVFGILFASRFKFVYTKSESDFLRTSNFFKLTIYKCVVSYTKVVLLQKTSFIVDRFNILLSVHQVVRIVLGGARTLAKYDGRYVAFPFSSRMAISR